MPIRPENKPRYPADWKLRSRFVRFYRARNRCEWCGAENGKPHPITGSKVVLTTAHVWDDRPEAASLLNLAALCQRCHNAHDAKKRAENARRTRRAKLATLDMFGDKSCLGQCTSSPGAAADCSPTLSSDTSQLSLLSGTSTPAQCCGHEPPTDGSQACTYSRETSEHSTPPNTPEQWIAFMRASLAKIFPQQASAPGLERAPEADSIGKSCVLLGWLDRDTCTWKTSQQSLITDSEPCLQTFPRSGLMRDGVLYELPMLEQTIAGIGGGVSRNAGQMWATPNTMDGMAERSYEAMKRMATRGGRKNRRRPSNLREQVSPLMCRAFDEARREANVWPTPLANCYTRVRKRRGSGDNLQIAVAKMSTPSANDWKGSSKPGQRRGQPTDPDMGVIEVGAALNPDWVEWLMGWPAGFTRADTPTSGHLHAQSGGWWDIEPEISRVTTEKTNRVARLKMLGNGQVPLQAAVAFSILMFGDKN